MPYNIESARSTLQKALYEHSPSAFSEEQEAAANALIAQFVGLATEVRYAVSMERAPHLMPYVAFPGEKQGLLLSVVDGIPAVKWRQSRPTDWQPLALRFDAGTSEFVEKREQGEFVDTPFIPDDGLTAMARQIGCILLSGPTAAV